MAPEARTSTDDVFINCPFDQADAPTFRALVFTIFACRFRPRSARDKIHLDHKTQGRRSSSRLPALAELMMEVPVASAGLIADRLGVTPRAAITMAAELGLRETTGRARYRAWGLP